MEEDMTIRTNISALALCLLTAGSLALHAQEATALAVTGGWKLAGNALKLGSAVPRDAALTCEKGSALLAGARDGSGVERLYARCADGGFDFKKAEARPASPAFAGLLAAAESYKGRSAEGFAVAGNREATRDVRDAVLVLAEGQVDLAPTLRDSTQGEYPVRIAPVAGGAQVTVGVQWTTDERLPVPAAALKPGLHKLTIGEEFGPGAGAVVLVCGPAEFASAAGEFQQVLDEVAAWPGDVDPAAARLLLRTLLERMAQPK
jgi:hypothetical protein